MLKSKIRILAVTLAVIAVAVFACVALVGLGTETLIGAYAADGQQTNYWKEINIKHWTYGDVDHAPTVTAAYGTPTYSFYQVDEKTGERIGEAYPNMNVFETVANNQKVPAGKYAMEATVLGTEEYTGLHDKFTFDVATATNRWENSPNITRWAENEAPNYPYARAAFGEVTFRITGNNGTDVNVTYYQCVGTNSANATRNTLNTMKAGSYILTTSVNGDGQNYTGIPEYQYEFRVFPAIRNEWEVTPYIADYTEADTPSVPVGKALYSDGTSPDFRFRQAGASNESARAGAPTTAGAWVMVVTVKTEGFVDLVAEVPFNVTKAKNAWKTLPSVKGWTEGQTPNAPTGAAEVGDMVITYSADGKTLDAAPTEAGDYIMHVIVAVSGYENLEMDVPFTVARDESKSKQNSWEKVPNIQGWREGQKANDPVGKAENGTVTFTYKNADGTGITDKRPNAAGDYTLVATVEAEGYATMVAEVEFTITDRIVKGDNAEWIAGICVLSAIVVMLIVACVILFIRSKGMTVKQAFGKLFRR